MSHRWTTEQQEAITAAGSNLLVSAGAGSGKTAVLVNRILRLVLEEGVPVERLLVVTFTKAAAGEMKERLRRELNSRRAGEPQREALIKSQLQGLNHAWITTFHGFCRQLLQRHFQEAGLEPRFRVLDATEADRLRREAVTEVLEAAYEAADPGFVRWVRAYSGNRTDQRLEDMILDLHSFLLSRPDPWEWAAEIQRRYEKPLTPDHPWVQEELGRRRTLLAEAVELLEQALALAGDPEGPLEYIAALEEDLRQADALAASAAEGPEAWSRCAGSLERRRLSPVSKNRKAELSPVLIELVKDLREEAWGILKAFREKTRPGAGARWEEELREAGAACGILAGLVRRFDAAYGALKTAAGAVDYGDLEHKALGLLGSEAIAQRYRDHFLYLFIDEYQDSNGVQEALLKSLQRPDNRFMVGDVKQSIYRFRLAEPQLFVGHLLNSSPQPGALNRRIDLNRNFRSRREIIAAINSVFSAVMTPQLGDVAYDEGARLIAGAQYPPCPADQITLTVLGPLPGEAEGDGDGAEYTAAEREARAVGNHILQVVGTPIWDLRSGAWRPAVWEDIAVLLRAVRPWRNTLNRVFDELGIPLSAEGGAAGDEAWEVHVVIHLLRLMGNSRQDLPLMVVLRSPLGGFTLEEMARIRGAFPEESFHEALRHAASELPELGQRLADFLQKLARWQEQCRRMPLGDFLWTLYEKEGFGLYCQAMSGGAGRRERLLWTVRQADQRSRLGGDTPEALADHLEALTEKGELPGAPEDSASGGVRVMSIHRSKGLEFPIVFMAGLGKRFNTADLREEVLRHRELGYGLRYVDPDRRIRRSTLVTDLIQEAVRRENLSEELRILYVGMTRAMDHLYLYGSAASLDKQFSTWIKGPEGFFMKNARCFLDWLLPPLLTAGGVLEPWEGPRTLTCGEAAVTVAFLSRLQPAAPLGEAAPAHLEAEPPAMLGQWPWRYPWEAATRIPSKLSVTEVNRLAAGGLPRQAAEAPRAYRNTDTLDGAELGTLHHLVLQHLPLEPADGDSLETALNRLVSQSILAAEDLAHIRRDWLLALLQSELGRRMLAADRLLREVPFVLLRDYRDLGGDAAGEVLIQGVIDCCFREEAGWVLVDYKTDSGQDPEETARRYGRQLSLYAEALAELTGEPVAESWLYLMRSGTAVKMKKSESS